VNIDVLEDTKDKSRMLLVEGSELCLTFHL
jgi:hypothetical protein